MNRLFKKTNYIPPDITDGTKIFPFLNPKDSESGLPFHLFDGFSIAAGEIEYGHPSKVHFHPFLTQVTFVADGKLDIRMKDTLDDTLLSTSRPYKQTVEKDQAIVTRPKAFLQLTNPQKLTCKVLYITAPEYLFEMNAQNEALYDDAIILEETWEQLIAMNWKHPRVLQFKYSEQDRQQAYARLSRR